MKSGLQKKDDMGLSTLYSLADFNRRGWFRIRKDEVMKKLSVRKYGAIPSLKTIDFLRRGNYGKKRQNR